MSSRRLAAVLAAGWLAACGGPPVDGNGPAAADGTDPAVARFAVRRIGFPGGPGSAQARLARLPDGRLLLSWLEPAGEAAHSLRFATLENDDTWGAVQTVVTGERFFVNWVDFPSVVPVTPTQWVAHWLLRQPDSFGAYDPMIAVSADGGRTWNAGTKLNEDTTEAEHGFVEVYASGEQAHALWLDGRELADWSFDNPDALLGVSLRTAAVREDGSIEAREVVDKMVCDCCQPDVAIGAGGPLVVYRDRTENEIRDIVVRRHDDGQWLEPLGVGNEGWRIEGCPVNGPAIAADGERAAIAWFTAADSFPRVRFARSEDGGRRFDAPVDLDADGAYGQVDIVLDDNGAAAVSWWRRAAEGGIDLAVRRVPPTGAPGPIRVIAHEDVSQPVDVPQMMAAGDGLVIAWSSFDGDGTVKAAVLSWP